MNENTEMRNHIMNWETIVIEGKAKIIIPDPKYFKRPDGVFEPAWAPVFYNPRMKENRDIAILVTYTYFNSREYFFVEPLAGVGIRSIRFALESQGHGIANDLDPLSYYYITRNIILNKVIDQVKPYNHEANTLLNSLRSNGVIVDYIDIDPYGSPIPFIESTAYAIAKGGLVGVTATDTGPLNCSYPYTCLRRYDSYCIKTDFSKEMGLRILIGSIIRKAASHDIAFKPILSYYRDYYYRVYFTVSRKATDANKLLDDIGYIIYDKETHKRIIIRSLDQLSNIEYKGNIIGPLWIGTLGDIDFITRIINLINKLGYLDQSIKSFLKTLYSEYKVITPYYRLDRLYSILRKNIPPINSVIKAIRDAGYLAYRTHFDPRGIRTNAPYEELLEILRNT